MAAMDPNKDTNNRAARLSPPVDGGQSTLLSSGDLPMFISRFEDMSRRCVRGVLQELSLSINLPPQPLPDPSIQARYRLQFINKVKDTTFTTDLVRDENENPIKVAIYDMYGQPIISPDCFLSSAKVRITVLDAEFWKNKGVNWSRSEFNQSVLKEREGKGPILIGHSLIIRLENGVGTFENIVFNDNSKWTKSRFGLGVMVEGEGEEGYLNGERVQEGVSESFRVKERRGKASQKPDRLKLTHKVQSLKKVGKNRSSLLQQKKIKTVEDFLKFYYNDEPALREILCIESESDKGWKSMVKHAMQCADEFQAKYNDLNNSSQPRQALVHTPGRTVSLQTNGGPRLVGSGSSVPNPCENNLLIPAYMQLPLWDLPPLSPVETQCIVFNDRNHANNESGNILNGDSVQLTNGGGFPQLELSNNFTSMEDLYATNAELTPNYFTQFPLGSEDFDAIDTA